LLAVAGTAGYLVVALAFPMLSRRLPNSGTAVSTLSVHYPDGRGILRDVMRIATSRGFAVDDMSTSPASHNDRAADGVRPMVEVILHVHGRGSVNELATELAELPGVRAVISDDVNASSDD